MWTGKCKQRLGIPLAQDCYLALGKNNKNPRFINCQKDSESSGLMMWLPSAQHFQITLLPWLKTVSWLFHTCWFSCRTSQYPASSGVLSYPGAWARRPPLCLAFYSVFFWDALTMCMLLSCTCSRSGRRSSGPSCKSSTLRRSWFRIKLIAQTRRCWDG